MKYIVILITLFSIIKSNAQNKPNKTINVYKWEAYTASGVIIFGVNRSKRLAQNSFADFFKRNEYSKYKPYHFIVRKSITEDPNYFKLFEAYCPKGYRLLYGKDQAILRICKKEGLSKAAEYYKLISNKPKLMAFTYVRNLYENFMPYRLRD